MLVLCLKQVKDLILEFPVGGSFFSEKTTFRLLYYTIVLVSIPLGGCVDEVVDSRANYQGFRNYVHFVRCHTFAVF